MTYRSKRTRLAGIAKEKQTKIPSVDDVVRQVIHDVADVQNQDEETLRSSCCNQSTDQAATDLPTQATYTDVDDVRSNLGKRSGRESRGNSPSQPSATNPSLQYKASRNRSRHFQDTGVQSNHDVGLRGAPALETQYSSSHNAWFDDPTMAEPIQATTTEVNDVRSDKRNAVERQFHTPSPSQPLRTDSPTQLNGSKRQSSWVEDDVEEPSHQRLSQGRRSKTAVWTDEIEFDEMEEVEMRDREGKRGKKGGRVLPRHVWSLQPGVRFVVPFNALDQPVRKGGHLLVKFLGDVAKNGELCPIGEISWHKVDRSCKAKIIDLIRAKFVLPAREEIDKCILKNVGNRWRAYRYKLKVQYKKPDKTQAEVVSIVPKGVDATQWEKLVQYWFSEKSQFLSEKGKVARALQSHHHTTGSKSFARMRDEFEKVNGREPGALEWFAQTHIKKDGAFVKDSSKEFLDAAAAMVAQRGSTSSPSKQIAIENRVFNELMYSDDERPYRPIGYGFGANWNKKIAGGEKRKREYFASGASMDPGDPGTGTRSKFLSIGATQKRSDYSTLDISTEMKRLNFAMAAMSETNQLMQAQMKKQSRQLKMQAQQLQLQSKQMDGMQFQLQQMTSLLTKFGVMLNNPKIDSTRRGPFYQSLNVTNAQVPGASSEYSDSDSDSIEWESD